MVKVNLEKSNPNILLIKAVVILFFYIYRQLNVTINIKLFSDEEYNPAVTGFCLVLTCPGL